MIPQSFFSMLNESRTQQRASAVAKVTFAVVAASLLATVALMPRAPASQPLKRVESAPAADCRDADSILRTVPVEMEIDDKETRNLLLSVYR